MIEAAIAADLVTRLTDDAVRKVMGKQSDFVVMPAVKLDIAKRKSVIIYDAVFKNIKAGLMRDGVVKVAGFGTIEKVEPRAMVEVGAQPGPGVTNVWPIFWGRAHRVGVENRAAVAMPYSWRGEDFPFDSQNGKFFWGKDWKDGEIFISNGNKPFEVRVDYSGPRGNGSYFVGFMNFAKRWVCILTGDPVHGETYEAAALDNNLSSLRNGLTDDYILENLGRYVAASVDDYARIAARPWSDAEIRDAAQEKFFGIDEGRILSTYPRRVRLYQYETDHPLSWRQIHKMPLSDFVRDFIFLKGELEADGSWPVKSRGNDTTIKIKFARDVLDRIALIV